MKPLTFPRALSAAAVCSVILFSLASCNDDQASTQQEQTPPTKQQPSEKEKAKEALFNEAVYTMGSIVSSISTAPELNEETRNMLELLRNYYAAMEASSDTAVEKAKLSLHIAKMTQDLNAFAKAQEAYETAQKDWEAQPEQIKQSTQGLRMFSNIQSGMGLSLLSQNRPEDALGFYEKALETDKKIAQAVLPKDFKTLTAESLTPEISDAASAVLDSLRCLGNCQEAVSDPEEARTTYQKGIDQATEATRSTPQMAIAAAKLMTNLGNLESSARNEKRALELWVQAAQIYRQVYAANAPLAIKAQAARLFEGLKPSIQSVSEKLHRQSQESLSPAS